MVRAFLADLLSIICGRPWDEPEETRAAEVRPGLPLGGPIMPGPVGAVDDSAWIPIPDFANGLSFGALLL